jgi:hypothetical protein
VKLERMIDEAALLVRECEDHATNLERAIAHGHVKRPIADVERMHGRHPAMRAGARALKLIAVWRERLPAEFIAEVESER